MYGGEGGHYVPAILKLLPFNYKYAFSRNSNHQTLDTSVGERPLTETGFGRARLSLKGRESVILAKVWWYLSLNSQSNDHPLDMIMIERWVCYLCVVQEPEVTGCFWCLLNRLSQSHCTSAPLCPVSAAHGVEGAGLLGQFTDHVQLSVSVSPTCAQEERIE